MAWTSGTCCIKYSLQSASLLIILLDSFFLFFLYPGKELSILMESTCRYFFKLTSVNHLPTSSPKNLDQHSYKSWTYDSGNTRQYRQNTGCRRRPVLTQLFVTFEPIMQFTFRLIFRMSWTFATQYILWFKAITLTSQAPQLCKVSQGCHSEQKCIRYGFEKHHFCVVLPRKPFKLGG